MKSFLIFLVLFAQSMIFGTCKISNETKTKEQDSKLFKYLEGKWIATGRPNGSKLEGVIRLDIDSRGRMKVEYLLAKTRNVRSLSFSVYSEENLTIESYSEPIRVQKFSENEFKFYLTSSSSNPEPREFEDTLFVYNFRRIN